MYYIHLVGSEICPTKITLNINNGRVFRVEFTGGCEDVHKELAQMVEGMDPQQAMDKLNAMTCPSNGSEVCCHRELAAAIKAALDRKSAFEVDDIKPGLVSVSTIGRPGC